MEYWGSLHNHTQYSNIRLRDCIIKEKDLIEYAVQLGHKVVGFTDHECISSWVKIEKLAKNYPDIKIIRGNEIYLCRNGLNADNFNRDTDKYYHFILLAKDLIGAKQIMEISTRAWRRSYMARGMRRVPTYYQDLWEIIAENPGHVIGTTACLGGALPTQILRGTDKEKLNLWINQMIRIFGKDNFYLEMQPSRNKEQIQVNRELFKFANYHGLNYIITTDSHYLKKEDRLIHKAYLNAQNGDREVDDFYATTYMMSTEELESYMKESFDDMDIVHSAYHTIEEIANKCEDFSLQKSLKIPNLIWKEDLRTVNWSLDYGWAFEKMPMLETFYNSEHISDKYLVNAIIDGIKSHDDLQNDEAYNEINSNLEMTWVSSQVNKAQWSAYYLNLQKIIDLCWEAGSIVGPGRGSGVGFILLYVLGITQINPLREKTKTFAWRFLNPDRVSVLDVDFDIEGEKRDQVLAKFREFYGDDRVANVATFRTEKSKSAILTAARGLGIDVDIAQYIASLIPADRGQLRTLAQCMYGDEENDWAPIKQFQYEMETNYPELWEVASKIEGLICGSGIHAGGVIFVDEPFTESTGLMRAPDGTICTQFELHDCEDVSLIKYDALSVEAMDKIHNCIDLLCDYGYAERKATLKETYESLIGIYKLERDDPKMWEMVWNHEIQSLFQMEKQSGIQGIAALHPTSVDDLATLNSVIRLMAQEKGGEIPTEKLARFKKNPHLWDEEMDKWGLSAEEKKLLHEELDTSYGICESQEGFMQLVQREECGGFNLTWADRLRKSIAKKNPKEFDQLTEEYFANMKEKGLSENLCKYVWKVLVAYSRGYGFNKSHTLAYSLIALQEMNLAYKYPIMFWNCACLISDSGGNEEDIDEIEDAGAEDEIYYNEMEEFSADDSDDDIESSYEEEDCDGYPAQVVKMKDGKKKKKVKTTNYGKIASAIGKIKMTGVTIAPPDINKSTYTFSPDIENNSIRYGLSGINKIGKDLVKAIMDNRPFSSIEDLTSRVKINKPQVINLIKSGSFDFLGDRVEVMKDYIASVSGAKKRLTLQNLKMLIDFGLIPDEYDLERRVYNFNKYVKKMKLDNSYYGLDNIALNFLEKYFDIDKLVPSEETESGFKILQSNWDKIYKKHMDIIRPFIQKNQADLLEKVNTQLMSDVWDKYCIGTLSKWEMDSISCYIHEHELKGIDMHPYEIEDFFEMSEKPTIDRYIPIKGKMVPLFKLCRIAGTVLDRDKSKKTVTLLTVNGVVTVKIYGGVFAQYDKQISERGADGKKHVIEKSMFTRGNKIIVTGIRQEDSFLAKTYSKTPHHKVEQIVEIKDGKLVIKKERVETE